MTSGEAFSIERPADDAEVKAFTRCISDALFFPAVDRDDWIQREGVDNIRIARRNGQLAGGLTSQPTGQW
ncbi:MAG: hypothetical protein PVI86_14590, partial [Phycisphaerae bacterium]